MRASNAGPADLDAHLVLDNYETHKTPLIHRWLAKRSRYSLHFTPIGASWINLVERWFAALTAQQLRRGVHHSTRELEGAIRCSLTLYNHDPEPFVWTKTAQMIFLRASHDFVNGFLARDTSVLSQNSAPCSAQGKSQDPGYLGRDSEAFCVAR